jgi:hypothetical protein
MTSGNVAELSVQAVQQDDRIADPVTDECDA